MQFDYIIDKIRAAEFNDVPFKHLYLDDIFSPDHLHAIIEAPEINLPVAAGDTDLFEKLFGAGYKIIDFPGCVTDRDAYVAWHRERRVEHSVSTACEGFGMTLRLMAPKTPIISELHAFLVGDEFRDAIAGKFGIDLGLVFPDSGIQKYLDGYEISPHPDIRKKALTYMVNINPHAGAESLDHHTHYLTFKDSHRYVQAFWEGNVKLDRCWVPWGWCETKTQQRKNNSVVIFSPSNDTMHGVKANYDHLKGQRTQLYGNLWYKECVLDGSPTWEDLVIGRPAAERKFSALDGLKAMLPTPAKNLVKRAMAGRTSGAQDANVITDRLKL